MKKRLERRRFTLAVLFAVCILAFAAANPSNVEAASKPKQVKNVKVVKTTAHTVKIKFDKVEGAEYYQVQLFNLRGKESYTSENGYSCKETLIREEKTKKTSFTFKNLDNDLQFGVKVKACKDGQYGKISEEVKGCMASTPVNESSNVEQVKNVKVVKTTEGTVKVKFKKVKGVEHYQILIFQAEQPTKYPELLGTPLVYAPKTKKTTYTIKNLIGNTPYYVQVRAYKDGQYGKMSKKAKCRTKGVERLQFVCNTCCVRLPYYKGSGSDYAKHAGTHVNAVYEVYHELHCGSTLY